MRLHFGTLLLAAICTAATAAVPSPLREAGSSGEVRALWVQRGSLTSASAIVALVDSAKAVGFNTLLVQVRGRGDAYYNSRLEPRGAALAAEHPTFDPLALVIATAHRAGIRVHAWVNVNLVAGAELPSAGSHVIYSHPEWLMVPRELAGELASADRRSPAYVARLARYARDHSDAIEGLYLSPIEPAAAGYTVNVIADIAARYAVDGIHLDYIRFPNDEFDYSPSAIAQFRAAIASGLNLAERREYERRAEGRPILYTQMFPQRWQEFRRDKLTALLVRVRAAVKAKRRQAVLSAAVWPDAAEAANHRLQDWRGWVGAGLLDVVCPMAYTADAAVFRSQIARVKQIAGRRPVWAGIGAYHLSASETIENIRAARRLGAQGIILFSYDNLVAGANGDAEYLPKVGRESFK
jgi:uncharacterized lipoprotein YddW (UPF0748 family)